MSECIVYHFTDTARLPWILDSGELRLSGAAQAGGYPGPDFLWATTNKNGSRTAAALCPNSGLGGNTPCNLGYKTGKVWLVRFTLDAADFEPWPEVTKRFPAWTPDTIKRHDTMHHGDNPAEWRTCCEPLGQSRWLAIDARTYLDPVWRQVDLDTEPLSGTSETGNPARHVLFASRMFTSMRISEKPKMYVTSICELPPDGLPSIMPRRACDWD